MWWIASAAALSIILRLNHYTTTCTIFFFFICIGLSSSVSHRAVANAFSSAANNYSRPLTLRFRPDGQFKILQVADMHYANGAETPCADVLPSQRHSCSDLNTTAFVRRLIAAEQPDLIVFSGDNIFGQDTQDPIASLNAAFAPAIEAKLPWAAILGNHDQESILSRREVMEHITTMDYTLSQVYPEEIEQHEVQGGKGTENSSNKLITAIDGFGNYHLEVKGPFGSKHEGRSVLNIYMLDSGDYSKVKRIHGYGWIQESQKKWFKELSIKLQEQNKINGSTPTDKIPALAYFHIPLVETRMASLCSISGVKQEGIGCAQVNSGFLSTLHEAGDVHAVFNGHDHVNDFCGNLRGNIKVCYGGGVGYHAYGKAGWSRRARVVLVSLRSSTSSNTSHTNISKGAKKSFAMSWQDLEWLEVGQISTWKRLDDHNLSTIDYQVLWSSSTNPLTQHTWWSLHISTILLLFILAYVIFLLFAHWKSRWPFYKTNPYTTLSLEE